MSLYKVEIEQKKIAPLLMTRLSDQQLTERYDLQEWLANHPQALGEPLLIIQKEFSGFDETGERLDLLALDTQGNLVLIENKRDQSGKDVVWQAIKYASYVAHFTTDDIIKIFSDYLLLNKQFFPDLDCSKFEAQQIHLTAQALIDDFFEKHSDLTGTSPLLNIRNSQRIILVAGDFRIEVTSAVLWLIERGIDIKCVKVSPYMLESQLLIQIQQIIPVPEASNYMVSLSKKDAEDTANIKKQYDKNNIKFQYWSQLLVSFEESGNELYSNINAKSDHWLNTGSGISGCAFTLIFLQEMLRVEFSIGRSNTIENKLLFDFFHAKKEIIESRFGSSLDWLRLDDKKSSRIQFSVQVDSYDKSKWNNHFEWHSENIKNLQASFKPFIKEAYQYMKQQS